MRPDDGGLERLVKALAHRLPTATPTIPELAEALGLDDDAANDLLGLAEAAGLVAGWDCKDGMAIILTPLGASAMGVRLEEAGDDFRWVPARSKFPKVLNSPAHRMVMSSDLAGKDQGPLSYFDSLADPGAREPVDIAADGERIEKALPPDAKGFAMRRTEIDYKLTTLVGLRPQWGATDEEAARGIPCIGCGGRELSATSCCVRCARTGIDHLLGPVTAADLKKLERPSYLAGLLEGGKGKAKGGRPGKATGGPEVKPKGRKAKGVAKGPGKARATA